MLNLLEHLTFYGAYHNNKWNVAIHIVFVPTIVMTALVFLAASGPLYKGGLFVPDEWSDTVELNLGFVLVLVYSAFYILLEPVAGFTASLFLVAFWMGATTAYHIHGWQAIQVALGIHVLSWAFQFVGHGAFEGRKPALMDNLLQSFVLAPLFVWLHILFFFGYRPQLQQDLHRRVEQELAKLKKKSS